jgi:hypothetical protein
MWNLYLDSYPPGMNAMYRQRREYDCNCCRKFIRDVGDAIAIINNQIVSVWDCVVPAPYDVVAKALATYVKTLPVIDVYRHIEPSAGVDKNREQKQDGVVITWNHFHTKIPNAYVTKGILLASTLGELRSGAEVFDRALGEIKVDALNTVLELIGQNSLYKGQEFKGLVEFFLQHKKAYESTPDHLKQFYAWNHAGERGDLLRFKNSSIGSLASDISTDGDLEAAVRLYEGKVAPSNYKRPTALVTKAMVDRARATIHELGLEDALVRRPATLSDISINNVLFANRDTRKSLAGDVFDTLETKTTSPMKFDRVEEVSIDDFIQKILPTASSIEVMLENKHASNLVSLVAPVDPNAPKLFKWDNPFSWSYVGEVTDSIKERVKAAGGNVTGDLRISLSWFNYDDLDLHLEGPGGEHIYFGSKKGRMPAGGMLDVDMNAGVGRTRTPVENIFYPDRNRMLEGQYRVVVNNFNLREKSDPGFVVEIEFDGQIHTFPHERPIANRANVQVAIINYSKKHGFQIGESLASMLTPKTMWGLKSQNFHEVSAIMLSPNYWDGSSTGNKHYFFMLKDCKSEGQVRGFYNEFLRSELNEHRKVFEMVGAKMKSDFTEEQLSGLGFSTTQRNALVCRVNGSFSRDVKAGSMTRVKS